MGNENGCRLWARPFALWSSVHSCMYVFCMQFSCMDKLSVHKSTSCLVSVSSSQVWELAFT